MRASALALPSSWVWRVGLRVWGATTGRRRPGVITRLPAAAWVCRTHTSTQSSGAPRFFKAAITPLLPQLTSPPFHPTHLPASFAPLPPRPRRPAPWHAAALRRSRLLAPHNGHGYALRAPHCGAASCCAATPTCVRPQLMRLRQAKHPRSGRMQTAAGTRPPMPAHSPARPRCTTNQRGPLCASHPNAVSPWRTSSRVLCAVKYTASHEWISVDDGVGTLGLTHYAQVPRRASTRCARPARWLAGALGALPAGRVGGWVGRWVGRWAV